MVIRRNHNVCGGVWSGEEGEEEGRKRWEGERRNGEMEERRMKTERILLQEGREGGKGEYKWREKRLVEVESRVIRKVGGEREES